ncbi:hypothetical protein StoSoilB13_41060 (plasmid) [Arthrobacter sp. StoSoilB13]|nr:hypothetical protein StoSoilB13_41060 [Arthrobacter sp. StoSoilB13]
MMVSLRITTKVATNNVTMTVTDSRDIFPDTGAWASTSSVEGALADAPEPGSLLASDVTSVDMRIPQVWAWSPAIGAGKDRNSLDAQGIPVSRKSKRWVFNLRN